MKTDLRRLKLKRQVVFWPHLPGPLLNQILSEYSYSPGAHFSKAPESFRARKTIFKSSVSKNGELYTLETSCMKGTSLHL